MRPCIAQYRVKTQGRRDVLTALYPGTRNSMRRSEKFASEYCTVAPAVGLLQKTRRSHRPVTALTRKGDLLAGDASFPGEEWN